MIRSPPLRVGITMFIGDALRELAGFLDGCEEEEGLVTDVGIARRDPGGSRVLSAEVELTLSAPGGRESGLALRGGSVDEDGRLGLALESSEPVVPVPDGRVEVEPGDVVFDPDGTVTVSLVATVPSGEEPAVTDGPTAVAETETDAEAEAETDVEADAATDGGSTGGDRRGTEDPTPSRRDRDVPPFRDPELLAEVYESCDTFAEMTDAIGMDVTGETVRRYMIDYGIHQPNSYDTGDDGDPADADLEADPDADGSAGAEAAVPGSDEADPGPDLEDEGSPVVLADGIGLPDDVTVETLVGTVKASNTLYEVERDIGVEREDALDVLRELDLLDLVVGRLSTEHERDIDREDIVERLREASATATGTPG